MDALLSFPGQSDTPDTPESGITHLALTGSGQDAYQRIRGAIEELNAELFAFPSEDLATAGRVLSIVTERANAVLARHA